MHIISNKVAFKNKIIYIYININKELTLKFEKKISFTLLLYFVL